MTTNQLNKAKKKLRSQEKEQIFKRAQSYVIVTGILPAIIDDIENLDEDFYPEEIKEQLQQTIKMLIAQDDLFLSGSDISVKDHQTVLKRMFRQWINSVFIDELKR